MQQDRANHDVQTVVDLRSVRHWDKHVNSYNLQTVPAEKIEEEIESIVGHGEIVIKVHGLNTQGSAHAKTSPRLLEPTEKGELKRHQVVYLQASCR